jgi:RHS repeat-associated protein
VRSSTGSTANAFTFTGEQTDASTGLVYLRARWYDPATGRFLSLDPMGDGYDYAYDNPVANLTDPTGRCVDTSVTKGAAHSGSGRLCMTAPPIEAAHKRSASVRCLQTASSNADLPARSETTLLAPAMAALRPNSES